MVKQSSWQAHKLFTKVWDLPLRGGGVNVSCVFSYTLVLPSVPAAHLLPYLLLLSSKKMHFSKLTSSIKVDII